jgi:hypothetical protein
VVSAHPVLRLSRLGCSPRCRSALCLAAGSAGTVLRHTFRRPWRKKLPLCFHVTMTCPSAIVHIFRML